MINNDILRRVRDTFELSDSMMITVFEKVDCTVSSDQVGCWLKKNDDSDYKELSDLELATFLNGFINYKREKKEGVAREPETCLNNNLILMKLKIALNLRFEDVLEMLAPFKLAEPPITKPVLNAYLRKSDLKQYRECPDQVLDYFLKEIQLKYHLTASQTDEI